MKKIIIDSKYNQKKYDLMHAFLTTFASRSIEDIEEQLNKFVDGCGIFYNDIGIVFSNDPSESIPGVPRDFQELEQFQGVGIYCDWYEEDSPLLLSYQEFYENLIPYINEKLKEKNKNQKYNIHEALNRNIEKYKVELNLLTLLSM